MGVCLLQKQKEEHDENECVFFGEGLPKSATGSHRLQCVRRMVVHLTTGYGLSFSVESFQEYMY